jgi:ATP-binding cassette, subfamily B, bacterial
MTGAPEIARVPSSFAWQMVRESALRRVLAMAGCVAAASVLESVTPFALGRVIDALSTPERSEALRWFVVLLSLGAGTMIFYRAYQWIEMTAGPALRAHTQNRQIGLLLNAAPAGLSGRQSGALVEAVKRSSMNVVGLAQIASFDLVNMAVVIVTVSVVIGIEDPAFLAMVAVWLVIFFTGTTLLALRCLAMGGALFASSGASAGQIGDVLRNFETVFNYGGQRMERQHLGTGIQEERRRAVTLRRYIFLMRTFGHLAVFTLFAAMTSLAFADVAEGTRTVGGFALVFTATNILIMTVFDLSRQLITIFENLGSLDGALDLLDVEQVRGPDPSPKPAIARAGSADQRHGGPIAIELRNVGFAYPNQPPLFENLNLMLEEGGGLGLVGPSGAGKTTLVRLMDILRLRRARSSSAAWTSATMARKSCGLTSLW